MCEIHDNAGPAVPPKFDATTLVDEVVVALSNARIYRPDHPRVTHAAETLVSGLEGWFEHAQAERFEIGSSDGFLFHDRRPLLGASLSAVRLMEPLASLGSGGLAFLRGTTPADVLALVGLLAPRKLGPRSVSEANAALDQRGAAHVRLLPPYRNNGLGSHAPAGPALAAGAAVESALVQVLEATPRAVYQSTVELLQDASIGAARGEALELNPARGLVERMQKRIVDDASSILGLARYERYDEFTFGHSIRVCLLAVQFGFALTKDEQQLNRIGLAALLHDIGKSRIPFELLHAKRRLEPAERTAVGQHTELGAEILLDMEDPDMLAVAVAFGHHRSDGGAGYPRTADEAKLSLATRLIKICDVYEALTAVRPYKARMSPQRAYRIMMGMQGHFDLRLLRRFIQVNGVFPVGSHVLLASGERALVRRQTQDVVRPVVTIQASGASSRPGSRGQERDLSELRDDEGWQVRELLLEPEAA